MDEGENNPSSETNEVNANKSGEVDIKTRIEDSDNVKDDNKNNVELKDIQKIEIKSQKSDQDTKINLEKQTELSVKTEEIKEVANTEEIRKVSKEVNKTSEISENKNELKKEDNSSKESEKSDKSKEGKMMDDDGEDLPDNFFDDFANNDFMAGLDIVDDWMEDEDQAVADGEEYCDDDEVSNRRENFRRPRAHSRQSYTRRDDTHRHDDRHRPYERSREREFGSRRSRSRDRDFERRRSSRDHLRDERRSIDRFRSREREFSRPRDHEKRSSDARNSNSSRNKTVEEQLDSRRDPEKTKRDIQRDKLRCAKDFEARVFQEQIKVSETGLVPPGTELDVVLEHEKRKQEEEQQALDEKPPERKKEEPHHRPERVERKRSFERFRNSSQPKTSTRHSPDFLNRDRHSRDRHSRERRSRERHSRSRERHSRSRERHSRDRRSLERLSRERHIRERRSRERRSRERRSRERRSRERRSRVRLSSLDRLLRDRSPSPDLRSRKREYVRPNRSRDRSLSPGLRRKSRSLDREEMMRRNDDLRLRIREKRREKLFNELSPVSEARFSRSPSLTNLSLVSNISERELWLRDREKNKSRYLRSCSPVSSSSDLGSPRRKRSRKTSFMEEIERKLRAKKASTSNHFPNSLTEPPQPVPPPPQFVQQMPMSMPYQPPNLFAQGMVPNPFSNPQVDPGMMMMHQHQPMPLMGMMVAPSPMGMMGGVEMMEQPMMTAPHVNMMPMQVQQPPMNSPAAKIDTNVHRTNSNLKPCVSEANKEVTKLFEEQKISLTDYLSVSAKPIDPKMPINVHKKIKVISKCQDVIRVLKEDSKFCGRFFPKPAPPGQERPEEKIIKWKSPLRKTFPVRFMFTTPSKKTHSQTEYVRNIINKLLFVCGIPAVPETPAVKSAKIANLSTSAKPIPTLSVHQSIPQSIPIPKPLPAPVSFTVAQQKPKHSLIPVQPQPPVIKRSTVGSQTDVVKCQICEIRSARKFSDQGCQTREKGMVDESTQVTNEDLQKSIVTFTPRGILKNSSSSLQSLSHLTPAQLLALQKESNDEDDWNIPTRNETFMSRNESFQSRNNQDYSGNYRNPGVMSSSFNSNSSMSRLMSNMTSSGNSSFSSTFTGGMDKQYNRPFSGQSPSKGGNWAGENRPGNFERYQGDRYSPEDTFADQGFNRNMGGSNIGMGGSNMGMNTNMAGRGRGGGGPSQGRGGFYNMGGNFGGPNNRPFNY